MKRILPLLLLLIACRYEGPAALDEGGRTADGGALHAENETWRASRLARLTAPDGWLSLVGLFWLNEGSNDVALPIAPPHTAHLNLENGRITLQPDPAFTIAGQKVTAATVLRDDSGESGPTLVRSGSLSFTAIKRSDLHGQRYGIRARDPQSEPRRHFVGLDYFPFDAGWRVTARFEPYDPPRKILITNVLGMISEEVSPGALIFDLQGQTVRLDPILEQGEKDLFIIFKDGTAGKETYPAARYLYASPPDAEGKTIVDFNRAYNPPCAFTPFATCPLPPLQNRMKIRIEAGEKTYAGHH